MAIESYGGAECRPIAVAGKTLTGAGTSSWPSRLPPP